MPGGGGGRQWRMHCSASKAAAARPISKAAALTLAALLAAVAAPLVHAAVRYDSDTDAYGGTLLTPVKGELMGRTFYFEIPQKAVGVLFMAHGCVHDANDFWPPSKECPECQGLPEEVSHTKQALARGYAVLAIDSVDREYNSRCFSYGPDKWGVKYVLENWTRQYKLDSLPIFALGVSAGASFVLKLPKITRINGIVSEVLGVTEESFSTPARLEETYPPTIFIDMQRDTVTSEKIAESIKVLKQFDVPVDIIKVDPRPVTPTLFYDRSEYISKDLSKKIVSALHKIGMLDYHGYLTQDPRYSTQPWREQLAARVPELSPDGDGATGLRADATAVSEQMNVAFARHEIISDHLTSCLAWLEALGTVPIAQLKRELQLKSRLRDLEAQRLDKPLLQDDDALHEAALQVDRQLSTEGIGDRENWGDMYAAYVDWLKTKPKGDRTFPTWRASPASGKFQQREGSTSSSANSSEKAGKSGGEEGLGAQPQHTSL